MLYLIQKEFIQIRRNAFLPRLIIVFPIVIMCVMPWIMSMEVKNVRVDIVDNDHSTLSSRLVHSIEASRYFIFGGQKNSYREALDDIEHGKADLVLVIPKDFSRFKTENTECEVLVAANAVNGTKGGMGANYVTQIVNQTLATAVNNGYSETLGGTDVITSLHLYNRDLNYKRFMIPALFAIVIMLMCGFLPTLNIVGEKETGTIEQMNVTPVSKWAFILSKLIPYWLIALFVITACLLLSWGIYGITCRGNVLWVYVLAMLLALFFSSFGLIISNYSDTMQQAIFVMWFFVMMLLLLSGLFTPTRSMPHWAYLSTYVNPMHYFIESIRTVFIRGGDWNSIGRQIGALAAIGCVMACWAVASYRKNSQ